MSNEQTPAADTNNQVDGGTPTPMEEKLAAELETLGDAPAPEEPVAAAPAPAPVADPAADAAAAAAAAAEAAAAAATAPAPAPAPIVISATPPPPPKDFDKEFETLQTRYDNGDIDGTQYQRESRALTREEGAWTADVRIWNEKQASAVQQVQNDFNSAALSWEDQHKDFMSNPLRANQMQIALQLVEKNTPGLAPSALFAQAQKIAFEAMNYTPPAAADPAAAVAAATRARQAGQVPPTLAASPAAAPIEQPNVNAGFASLDAKDINSLENDIARMNPQQLDAYLREAPGSTTTGP